MLSEPGGSRAGRVTEFVGDEMRKNWIEPLEKRELLSAAIMRINCGAAR